MLTLELFLTALREIKDVNRHYAFIDLCAKQGRLETLTYLFAELSNVSPDSQIPDWAYRALIARILDALALSEGYENAALAITLSAKLQHSELNHYSHQLRPAAVASKIVAAQSTAVIDQLLATQQDLEICALLLHEAAAREKLIPSSCAAEAIVIRLKGCNHPLASLPIALQSLETGLGLPHYNLGSMSCSIPFGPTRSEAPSDSGLFGEGVTFSETTLPGRAAMITSAVQSWKKESNGKIEARTFQVKSSPLIPIGLVIRNLGLDAVGPKDELHCREPVPAKEIFTILFSAASNGGAYNQGAFAAYGRLLAWQSMRGLVGADENAEISEIAAQTINRRWCVFETASDWYYGVAWDFGLVCVNVNDDEMAILAATDTD